MKRKMLITDVDNTLFDWFDMWHSSFSAMLNKVVEISGLEREQLLSEMQVVFRAHGTSEYSHVLEECPSLASKYPNVRAAMNEAIEAYRSARSVSLVLYDGVKETLQHLKSAGVLIVAYTESMQYYTSSRFKALGIDDMFDALYSPADHVLPRNATRIGDPVPTLTKRVTPVGVFKPSTVILTKIVNDFSVAPEECIYIGDSELKDISMANDVGIYSVYAKYGATHFDSRSKDYSLLQRVSHWSDEDIEREKRIKDGAHNITPSMIASNFGDVAKLF